MTHIITSLCLRDSGCVDVCPVECIVPGMPQEKYPLYYIDPDTCIDCGACVPECPYEAIFSEDDVPEPFVAAGGEIVAKPEGTAGYDKEYTGENQHGVEVKLSNTKVLEADDEVDFDDEVKANYEFFEDGPGYWEGWEDHAN
jgi:NAD-dependent dihydropyrimidine dehydrogenase PreA subunit